ncbi:MAG: CPBP family intramembrane glutamic endopeptidase [Candidatus Binatales bacterium]
MRSAILGVFIALFGQLVWAGLIGLWAAVGYFSRTSQEIPWPILVMAPVIWLMWQYLGGRWWPRSTAEARHRHLRANRLSAQVLVRALLAGGLSIVSLAGLWIVTARIVRMANVLPKLPGFPRLTVALMIGMGSLLGPLLEQAGFWGYCQSMLEEEFPGPAAILMSSALFAMLPHPPVNSALWPRLLFYFLTGVTFGTMAYLTNSILPGVLVHIVGDLSFFTLVWPYDAARPLIGAGGPDAWFWIHATQAIVFVALAIVAFGRLARGVRQEKERLVSS